MNTKLVKNNVCSRVPGRGTRLTTTSGMARDRGKNGGVLGMGTQVVGPRLLASRVHVDNDLLPSRRISLSFRASKGVMRVGFRRNDTMGGNRLLTGMGSQRLRTRLRHLISRLGLTRSHMFHRGTLLRESTIDGRTCRRMGARLTALGTSVSVIGTGVTLARLHTPFSNIVNLQRIDMKTCTSPDAVMTGLAGVSPLGMRFTMPRQCTKRMGGKTGLAFRLRKRLSKFSTGMCTARSGVDRVRSLAVHTLCPGGGNAMLPNHCMDIRLGGRRVPGTVTMPSRTVIPRVKGSGVCLCGGKGTRPMRVSANVHARTRMRMLENLRMNSAVVASKALRLHATLPIALSGVSWADHLVGVSRLDVHQPMLSAMLAVVVLLFKFVKCDCLNMHRCPSISGPVVSMSYSCPNTGTSIVRGRVARPLRRGVGNVPNVHSLSDIDRRKRYHVAMRFRLSISLRATTGSIHSGMSHTRHCLPHSYSPPAMSGTSTSTVPVLVMTLRDREHSLLRLDRVTSLAMGRRLRAVTSMDDMSV